MGKGFTYGSVCSGIEAATVAWHPLGWKPAFFSEIEAFPRAVLTHHYPQVPLHGDFTTIQDGQYDPIDLLVGGTPCQSFSVAGLRGGLDDGRGQLALEYLRLADRLGPRWLVWENVPGVLSSGGGRDFGSFLGGLVELGYGFAYRILDAQFVRVDGFGRAIPQRRRRVFVVGYRGDWRRAAAVLLERSALSGAAAPRRAPGETVAPTLAARLRGGGGLGSDFEIDGGLVAFDPRNVTSATNRSQPEPGGPCHTLHVRGEPPAIAFSVRGREGGAQAEFEGDDVAPTLRVSKGGSSRVFLAGGFGVRSLMPIECERLTGLPDDYTLIPWKGKLAPDTHRYNACGNSMGVNVMRWIGRRIAAVEALPLNQLAA